MTRRRPITSIRPSQLYLSRRKLRDVLSWFDAADPNYSPLPVFEYEGSWYLADGHTRAFAAALAGTERLRVEDIGRPDDWAVYLTCLEWCADAGVDSISDLFGRIVEPETYEREWVQRCQAIDAE